MVRRDPEVGEKQWLAGRLVAATIGFNGDKNGIDVFQGLSVRRFQYPALLRNVVFVKYPELEGL